MDFFQAKYRTVISITFVLLLTLPCSLKAEFKQFLGVEFTQKNKISSDKTSCVAFSEIRQTQTQKFKTAKEPFITAKVSLTKRKDHHALLAEFFSAQKEKIPSHLLYCQFLI